MNNILLNLKKVGRCMSVTIWNAGEWMYNHDEWESRFQKWAVKYLLP